MLLLVSQSVFTVAESLLLKYWGTQDQCVRGAEGPQGRLEMQKEAPCQDWSWVLAVCLSEFRSVLSGYENSVSFLWGMNEAAVPRLFYWSTAALQCCVNFCCTAKWLLYVCVRSSLHSFPLWPIQGLNIGPCAIQWGLVCPFSGSWFAYAKPGLPTTSLLSVWICSCFIAKFICIIFFRFCM